MSASPRLARLTGLFYFGMIPTGVLGFVTIRPKLFDATDADATLANVLAHPNLAQWAVVLELGVVLFQALAAVYFWKLFRDQDNAPFIALFGLVNATVILTSSALLGVAGELATGPNTDARLVHAMWLISGHLWSVGAVFFGLWLIPMGWCALQSGWLPRPLGWIVIAGGVGYLLSAFTAYAFPDADALTAALPLVATVGEVGMVIFLLLGRTEVRSRSGSREVAA